MRMNGKIKSCFLEFLHNRIVFIQKITRSSDISKRKIFADIDNHVKTFESEKKELFSRRHEWLEKNPEYSHPDLVELDTCRYSGENVLVISPHPDDEIIGCGGTLIKMIRQGSSVSVVQLTDGSNTSAFKGFSGPERHTIRLEEAKIVAKNIGFSELFFFKELDSFLTCTKDNVEKLSAILNRLQPKAIFVPFINDPHPDHRAANEILCISLESCALDLASVNVVSYEVWTFVPPNTYCIIDNLFDKKSDVLRKYHTAMKIVDYVQICESLDAYHSFTLLGKKGFVEVFFNLDAKKYVDLIRKNLVIS
jgi:LmbE family N-acetylglucosaminyl deacetylase